MKNLTIQHLHQLLYYIEKNKGEYFGWRELFNTRENELKDIITLEIESRLKGENASEL